MGVSAIVKIISMKEVEKMRNSKYTKEFRDETVQLILNSEKSAMQIAKLYETELPSYIEEIKALGSIPFYKKVQKTKIGKGAYWKASKEPMEFHEVLSKFHKIRVKHLKEHGWIVN